MINYWWVTRPKRKLNSVPEVLSTFAQISLDQEWETQRNTHLSFEDALEKAHLKRIGERRDQTGGGARTYAAWISSLGLIFKQESSGKVKLTLAGEAIMSGESPVEIIKTQIFKYQFPSAFSIGRGVNVSSRFRIRPFRFLLRLLLDIRVKYLTEEEIAKIVIVNAENESDAIYENVVSKILTFRNYGDKCLDEDFFDKYAPGKGNVNIDHPFSHLTDTANTIVNWMEYTQLAKREDGQIWLIEDAISESEKILSTTPPFIDRPEQQEFFQRKYGVDPKHSKDNRNLTETKTVTDKILADQRIKQAFISESLKAPISKISDSLIYKISEQTGYEALRVGETLQEYYPRGAVGSFMTEYFEMAYKGKDEAIEFEKATAELFQDIFGFETKHIGPIGLTPDVLIISNERGFVGILDNKAYSRYSITNDHKNRMVHNYIPAYSKEKYPLAFFSYIAGGFSSSINSQIQGIVDQTSVHGSAIGVTNVIKLVENHNDTVYDHERIKQIFSLDRQVLSSDL